MIRGTARVFFLKVCLQNVDDLAGVCDDFVGGRISDGVKVGLVFGVGLEACCGFEDVMVALRALFI